MEFRKHKPERNLAEVIDCFWYLTGSASELDNLLAVWLPELATDIVFINSGQVQVRSLTAKKWQPVPQLAIWGLTTTVHDLQLSGEKFSLLGIRTKPGKFYRLATTSLAKLGPFAPASQVWSSDVTEQFERLKAVNSQQIYDYWMLLNEICEYLLLIGHAQQPVIENYLRAVLTSGQQLSIADLAALLKISARQLERLSKVYLGLRPVQLSSLVRFTKFLKDNYQQQHQPVITTLANADARKFTGQTARELLTRLPNLFQEKLW